MLAKHTPEGAKQPNVEEARAEFHAQPRMQAVREHDHQCMQDDRPDDMLLGFWGDATELQVTRESYIEDARDQAISTYAYVRDGEWYAPGEMGWWGVSTDGEKDKRRFVKEFNKMLDDLPDDTLLTIVDCHI